MKNKCLPLIIGSKINLKCVSNDYAILKKKKITEMTIELSGEAVLIFVHVFEQVIAVIFDI